MRTFKITIYDYDKYYTPSSAFIEALGPNPNQLPREKCPSGKVAIIEGTLKDLPFCQPTYAVIDSEDAKRLSEEDIKKLVYVGDLTVDEAITRSQVVECF
jgi:hypothetical protein